MDPVGGLRGARDGAWTGNSIAAPGRGGGARAGAPLGSLWQGGSVPLGHRVLCLPLPNTCYPSECHLGPSELRPQQAGPRALAAHFAYSRA